MYKFNNAKKEISFDKYNTPTPWMNYFSNGTFHTMMSQAGGGRCVLQIAADMEIKSLQIFPPSY